MNTATAISTAALLVTILLAAINTTNKAENAYNENSNQFECGFSPMSPSHLPFSFQFFLIAILFLIFDVEISMVLSYPLETNQTTNTNLILLFLLIILIGLIYEWNNGNIDWSN